MRLCTTKRNTTHNPQSSFSTGESGERYLLMSLPLVSLKSSHLSISTDTIIFFFLSHYLLSSVAVLCTCSDDQFIVQFIIQYYETTNLRDLFSPGSKQKSIKKHERLLFTLNRDDYSIIRLAGHEPSTGDELFEL